MLGYKYRGGNTFERDITSIAEDYFWASSIEQLNDPFEAVFDTKQLKPEISNIVQLLGVELNSVTNDALNKVIQQLERLTSMVATLGVFSLARDYNNHLLWAHYAAGHTGFCVGYETDILKRYLTDYFFANHQVLEVVYSKEPSVFATKDIMHLSTQGSIPFFQKMVATKLDSWSYEKEVRIVADSSGKKSHDFRAVQTIYFGARMPQDQIRTVMEKLQGRGISYYRMSYSSNSYKLDAIPVDDLFQNTTPYLYAISPIAEDVVEPHSVRPEWQPYLAYLHQAVEVQRRDPYCTEVSCAAFSVYNSKPGHPVVFVNYKYNDLYLNRDFTLEQITELYTIITDLQD
jgi:hypothetical protein